MSIPVKHTVVISAAANDAYPYTANCSCLWQAHARTLEQAKYFAGQHNGRQAYLGNPVELVLPDEVEVKDESGPVGSVEAAGAGDPIGTEQPLSDHQDSGSETGTGS